MSHEIVSAKKYTQVLGVLLVLTVVTVLAAQFDAGPFNTLIAMGIASVKAYFVGSIFMNLRGSGPVNVAVFVLSVFFLMLLFLIPYIDIWTRVSVQSVL